jgi:hypothetical protein
VLSHATTASGPKTPTTPASLPGEISIAYQVVGNGPVDLVMSPGFVSHLELRWTDPGISRFLARLASFARLIIYDKPGTGLSDPYPATAHSGARRASDDRCPRHNAGRSIRRSPALSHDRFHDFERTMQHKYFAPQLILGLLPDMREHRSGQIVNVSTIGVQTNAPKRGSAASEFSVERWAHRPLRRKTPQSGRSRATAEQELWPI